MARFSVTLALFLALGSLGFAPATQAAARIEVAAPAPVSNATVNVYCYYKYARKQISTSGSGIFVSPTGVILTNAHVAQDFFAETDKRFKGSCTIRTGSPARNTYTAAVIYFPNAWIENNRDEILSGSPRGTGEDDFALLAVTGTVDGSPLPSAFPYATLETLRAPAAGEAVRVAGYPAEGLSFRQTQIKLPQSAATSTIENAFGFSAGQPRSDIITLSSSLMARHGVSGGPVFDGANRVLAIATGKSSSKSAPTLRAITGSYLNREVMADTGLPLASLFVSNFSLLASSTLHALPEDAPSLIRKALQKAR